MGRTDRENGEATVVESAVLVRRRGAGPEE